MADDFGEVFNALVYPYLSTVILERLMGEQIYFLELLMLKIPDDVDRIDVPMVE